MLIPNTTKVRSLLSAKVKPGQRDQLIEAFLRMQVFEACRQTVPGFISGELLVNADDMDALLVSVLWSDQSAWQQWQDSPLRLSQQATLAPFLTSIPASVCLQVHAVGEV